MYIDRRDAEVVKRLEEGERYSVTQIKNMYLKYTDITRERTAKERKKTLLKSPCFEAVSRRPGSRFEYLGVNQDE